MVDSFQLVSSIPLPQHQTQQSTRDPLPVGSQEQIQRTNDADALEREEARFLDFRTYLDQRGIMNLAFNTRPLVFDTARDIQQNSIYGQAPGAPPV